MENIGPLKVLLVAEGSGGHLIPALQVAGALRQRGARIKVWYATRPQISRLAGALTAGPRDAAVEIEAIPIGASRNPFARLWQCGQLWSMSQRCFNAFAPDVVVGFGGWVSAPVVLAARRRRIGCLLHEQNVVLGRANRWLARCVDRIALSFHETQAHLNGTPSVVTGMPVRDAIGRVAATAQASRFGLSDGRPTLLVLGGSQGSRFINRLMSEAVQRLSAEERSRWQLVHVTGPADEAMVKAAYAAAQVAAWVAPFLVEMEAAYAPADVVIARAGASTIAELARCGKPSLLIPYPYAGGHQVENARLVASVGGGVVLEEPEASPEKVVATVRRLLADRRLREMMGAQVRRLATPDAAQRITQAVIELHAAASQPRHAP